MNLTNQEWPGSPWVIRIIAGTCCFFKSTPDPTTTNHPATPSKHPPSSPSQQDPTKHTGHDVPLNDTHRETGTARQASTSQSSLVSSCAD